MLIFSFCIKVSLPVMIELDFQCEKIKPESGIAVISTGFPSK